MKFSIKLLLIISFASLLFGCNQESKTDITAADILGNPEYLAFSYGGYRENTREVVPTIEELKDDMKILSAMGVKLIRTYNTQQYGHTANLLQGIKQLKDEDSSFEMYVMLGTWIECEGAWSASANHKAGNVENNTAEIEAAVKMAQTYPDIVKIIAVGNEAMVQWAINYFVYPNVILKWVNYLKELRDSGKIPSGVWITSSDNYESWGGGAKSYQTDELAALIKAVDFISLHTYPFHDSHYNPTFWGVPEEEEDIPKLKQIEAAMLRAKNYAISQYQGAVDYMTSLGINKAVHIGETGWATIASSSYGVTGSRAADEYKEKLYYEHMRDWTNTEGMSCFYFEAFDEKWKDQGNSLGSENHFGLINLKGEAKFALWEMVDEDVFEGLTRNGLPITKTYDGDQTKLMEDVLSPPFKSEMGLLEIATVNENRKIGQPVNESTYVVVHETLVPESKNSITYPSEKLKLNAWEGTCGIEMSHEGIIEVKSGTGSWWGCALEIVGGTGENLSNFKSGKLNFEIKGNIRSSFQIGFQTGSFAQGTQTNNQINFGLESNYLITDEWKSYSFPIAELDQGANLNDVTAPLFFRGDKDFDGKDIYIKNIYYSIE
jgi:exo-beta-1,3-glucanase (GH17 family)